MYYLGMFSGILGIIFQIALWVVIWVIVSLLVRKILKDGWKSLLVNPFKRLIPARSTKNDTSLWDHLDE